MYFVLDQIKIDQRELTMPKPPEKCGEICCFQSSQLLLRHTGSSGLGGQLPLTTRGSRIFRDLEREPTVKTASFEMRRTWTPRAEVATILACFLSLTTSVDRQSGVQAFVPKRQVVPAVLRRASSSSRPLSVTALRSNSRSGSSRPGVSKPRDREEGQRRTAKEIAGSS